MWLMIFAMIMVMIFVMIGIMIVVMVVLHRKQRGALTQKTLGRYTE